MATNITKNDFDKICRICVQLDLNLITIDENIQELFLACTSVQVNRTDGLPQNICSDCHQDLRNALFVKQKTEISDRRLRMVINESFDLKDEIESLKVEVFDENYSDNGACSPLRDESEQIFNSTKTEALPLLEVDKNVKLETLEENDLCRVDDNLTCDICHKVFLNKHKLKKHLVAHSNHRPYQCTLCTKAFKEKFILNKHLKTVHTDPTRKKICQICGRAIAKTSLERHLKTHENPPSFQCSECTKKFLDAETLEKHIRRVHRKETSIELYPFLCNTCGKGLISKSELKRHMNSHSKEAQFKCNKCGKLYTSHAGLRSHVKVFHLNERPFVCTICSRAFPTKIILKHHMRTHTGEKPYACLICTKTFALKCVLQTHMKVHK